MSEPLLKLENQLCFPLYAAAKEVVARYKPFLDAIGLTYTQYITMLVLWEHKTVSAKELGARLYLDSGTLTPLLKRLEGKGLVRRRRPARDERLLEVSITAKGQRLQEKAAQVPLKMQACISLGHEDTLLLYTLLYKLLHGLEEADCTA